MIDVRRSKQIIANIRIDIRRADTPLRRRWDTADLTDEHLGKAQL